MLWKLLIRILRSRESSYVRMVKVKNELYIVRIEKYECADDFIGRIEKALRKQGAKEL